MTELGDNSASGTRGRGRLRASHADRERVIEVLKDAFVHGRLNKGELDARVGQALASRTQAELAALTADIPAASPTRQPAPAQNRAPRSRTARDVLIGLIAGLIVAAIIVFGGLLKYGAFGVLAIPIVAVVPLVLIGNAADQRRSRKQLPPPSGQGAPTPEVQRPGRIGHGAALPPDRPDQTCADLRSRRGAWTPRGIRPVPDAG